jgi:hypothetical protein
MRFSRRRIVLATTLGITTVLVSTAAPARSGTGGIRTGSSVPSAAGAVPAAARAALHAQPQVCGPPYVANDPRLGPVSLPHTGYFGFLLRGYVPLGGISPMRFIDQYWDTTATPPSWRYPQDQGFAHAGGYSNSRPLRFRVTLGTGQRVDRFGSEFGSYLASGATPVGGRALPPDSLNTRADDPTHLCNYHLYQVARSFDVNGGPSASAFQQPGQTQQYVLVAAYVPGAPTTGFNVRWLVDNGYLTRVY